MQGRKKKLKLTIAGVDYSLNNLAIGETKTFDGCGVIRSTAIERTSKNYYDVSCITEHNAVHQGRSSLSDAVDYLQKFYNRYGVIMQEA